MGKFESKLKLIQIFIVNVKYWWNYEKYSEINIIWNFSILFDIYNFLKKLFDLLSKQIGSCDLTPFNCQIHAKYVNTFE